MIQLTVIIDLKPGKREAFLAEFAANVPNVRAEKSRIEYGTAVDLPTDISAQIPLRENVVIIPGKWAALDALHTRLAAAHRAEYRPKVKGLIVGSSYEILEPM